MTTTPPHAVSTSPAPPAGISEQAAAALRSLQTQDPTYPPLSDKTAWRAFIDAANDGYAAAPWFELSDPDTTSRWVTLGGVQAVVAEPAQRQFPDDKVVLDIRGGALIYMSGELTVPMARMIADTTRATVVSVDYRKPPEHPFPAGLDDCVAVYRALLETHTPQDIIVQGGSAGGNVAAALVLRARDLGLPLPAGVVLLTPEVDLTESGDSFRTNDGLDVIRSLMPINELYANGLPLNTPLISPLFADFTPGYPPTLLQTGTRDLFLSNTVRMHRALRSAGVDADLHVWDAMPHGGFNGSTPEDQEVNREVRAFLARFWTDHS